VPIVTPQEWSQVQFELQLRRQRRGLAPGQTRPTVTNKHLMSGIFTCGRCDRGLVGHTDKRRASKRRTYRCPPAAHGGCGGISIVAEPAEKAVEEAMDAFLAKLFDAPEIAAPCDAGQLTLLHQEIDRTSARKRELIQRWTEGTLPEIGLAEDDYFRMLTGLNRKISTLRDTISTSENGASQPIPKEDLIENWRNGSVQQRRAILRRYLHGITVLPPGTPEVFNRSALVRNRLRPVWKTAVEIAA
jgi:hypothetical protein